MINASRAHRRTFPDTVDIHADSLLAAEIIERHRAMLGVAR
jgi:hypothetical protein